MTAQKALLGNEIGAACHTWVCDEPQAISKGCRSAFLWKDTNRSERPKIQLCLPERPYCNVFGVTWPNVDQSGKEGGRAYGYLNLQLAGPEQEQLLLMLDEYALQLAQMKCKQWFGHSLAPEAIQQMYVPLVTQPDRVLLRFSPSSCNFWRNSSHTTNNLTPLTQTALEAGARISPCFSVNGIYFKSRQLGLSLTCTDILLQPAVVFPFHSCLNSESDHCLPEHEDAPTAEEMLQANGP